MWCPLSSAVSRFHDDDWAMVGWIGFHHAACCSLQLLPCRCFCWLGPPPISRLQHSSLHCFLLLLMRMRCINRAHDVHRLHPFVTDTDGWMHAYSSVPPMQDDALHCKNRHAAWPAGPIVVTARSLDRQAPTVVFVYVPASQDRQTDRQISSQMLFIIALHAHIK